MYVVVGSAVVCFCCWGLLPDEKALQMEDMIMVGAILEERVDKKNYKIGRKEIKYTRQKKGKGRCRVCRRDGGCDLAMEWMTGEEVTVENFGSVPTPTRPAIAPVLWLVLRTWVARGPWRLASPALSTALRYKVQVEWLTTVAIARDGKNLATVQ